MLSTHPGEHGTLIIRSSQLRRGMVGAVEDRTATTPVVGGRAVLGTVGSLDNSMWSYARSVLAGAPRDRGSSSH